MLVGNNNSSKYLSLKTASELYGYTRDHLGLMIRKGKLKGTKLGNYYVTTSDWMAEYVKNFSDPNHPTSKNKLSNRLLMEILASEKKIKTGVVFKNKGSFLNRGNNNEHNKENLKITSKKELKSDFESEILKELSELSQSLKYRPQTNDKTYADSALKNADLKDYRPKIGPELPYTVLPIRKMEISERENILNRTGSGNGKKDTA